MFTYLFEAHLNDGSIIQQTHDDVSLFDSTKSAFYDVRTRMDKVVVFGLFNDTETWHVDLIDGSFYHNDKRFLLPCPEVTPETTLRLIYYRQHEHSITNGLPDSHTIQFIIGWQTTLDGKNYQRTIAVS